MSDPVEPVVPPTPETGTVEPPATPDTPPVEPTVDLAAEAEKWKALARKNEDKAKANAAAAKKLEELQAAQMSESEKAIAAAREEGRTAALVESGRKVAVAEIRAAAVGRDPEALAASLEFLNVDTFITDDGEVDAAKVSSFVAVLPLSGAPAIPGVPAGARTTPPTPTLAEQAAEAKASGDTRRYIALQTALLQPKQQ